MASAASSGRASRRASAWASASACARAKWSRCGGAHTGTGGGAGARAARLLERAGRDELRHRRLHAAQRAGAAEPGGCRRRHRRARQRLHARLRPLYRVPGTLGELRHRGAVRRGRHRRLGHGDLRLNPPRRNRRPAPARRAEPVRPSGTHAGRVREARRCALGRREPQRGGAHRPVRQPEVHQHRHQPLGVQAGRRLLTAVRQMVHRSGRRRLVLRRQRRFLPRPPQEPGIARRLPAACRL